MKTARIAGFILCGTVLWAFVLTSVNGVESQSESAAALGLVKEVAKLQLEVAELQRGSSPIGSIIAFAGPRPALPGTWLACDGRALVQSEYRELFNVIHDVYGSNGEGTFRLPNLHDRFLLGNTDAKESGGKWTQSTSEDGEHQHDIVTVQGRRWFGDDNADNQFRNAKDGKHHHTVDVKPPYTTAIYMIRVK